VGPCEDGVHQRLVPGRVDGERTDLGAAVGQQGEQAFIQSVYASSVFTPSKAPVWAENVAPGWQYCAHNCHPCPVSQASKNCSAVSTIEAATACSLRSNRTDSLERPYREHRRK
jgi:hypothetical protein